ncbi:MAG TPA: hypothetical protein DCE78_02715 [Bacteroidetes bacterium]|nr:hypothetical protein [Bacteroidota bacterium]
MPIQLISLIIYVFVAGVPTEFSASDDWIEILIEFLPDELEDDQLYEIVTSLEVYAQNPIPIENLDESHLIDFRILDEFEITSIISWKESLNAENMTIASFQENLKSDQKIVDLLNVFIQFSNEKPRQKINSTTKWDQIRSNFTGHFDIKISGLSPVPIGYGPDSYYRGSNQALKEHVAVQMGQSRVNVARNKVSGESHNYPLTNGQSTYSIYLNPDELENVGIKNSYLTGIYLGDFKVRFGLGSIAASGTMRVDSRSVRTLNTSVSTISQNSSSTSGKFLRGIGLTSNVNGVQLTLIGASRKLTSSVNDSLYYLPSWYNHIRTQNDLLKHHNMRVSTIGSVIRYNRRFKEIQFTLGLMGLYHQFGKPITTRNGVSYEHDFSGKSGFETSLSGSIQNQDLIYTFEIAGVKNGSGIVHSIQGSWENLNMGVWHRHYSTGFKPFLGNAPSAFSGNGNESGVGFWIRYRPQSSTTIESWGDRYQSHDVRFGTIAPISGHELGLKSINRINKTTRLEITFRAKSRLNNQINLDEFNREINQRTDHISNAVKLQLRTQLVKNILSVQRLEFNRQEIENQRYKGIGLSQMIRLQVKSHYIYIQHTVFNASDHQSRLYFYEYDMINSLSMPSFSGMGHRSYLMLHLEFWKKLIMRMKIGRVLYSDRYIIGTNQDSTFGNSRFNLAMQMRYRF